MYFHELEGTCSMIELCNLYPDSINDSDFNENLERACKKFLDPDLNPNRSWGSVPEIMLFNSTFNLEQRKKFRELGWRQILKYEGDEGTVYSFVKKIEK